MLRRLVAWLCLATLLLSCSPSLSPDQVAGLQPSKPSVEKKITVYYNESAKEAQLKDMPSITAQVLICRSQDLPKLVELAMQKVKNTWQADFNLTEAKPTLLLYRFVAGEKMDDRHGDSWYSMIYANGKPVQGSHFTLFTVLRQKEITGFKVDGTLARAREELEEELKLYPNNAQANSSLWRLQMRELASDSIHAAIKTTLERVYEANKDDEESVAHLLDWFVQTDQLKRSQDIKAAWLAKNPTGKLALNDAMVKVRQQRDPAQRIIDINKLLADFPLPDQEKQTMQNVLIHEYDRMGQLDKAIELIGKMDKPDASTYNMIAWRMIEKGEQLDQAIELTQKGMEQLRQTDMEKKPSYLAQQDWRKMLEKNMADILDTYGLGLYKLGKMDEAEKAFAEAYAKNNGESEEINARLVECYLKNGKAEKALEVAEASVSNGKANEKLISDYKAAYQKINGSAVGFEVQLQKLQDLYAKKVADNLVKERLNQPAPDFELKSLDGRTIKLSAQKGKVVVVDFWATWCGPCKMSFPFLQQVYEQYQKNPQVLILAVNTWERVQGNQREELVRNFIATNKYTFPVLLDTGAIVEQYNVSGIPTKFILDKRGKMAFTTLGFDNGPAMIQEMTKEIDLLLAE